MGRAKVRARSLDSIGAGRKNASQKAAPAVRSLVSEFDHNSLAWNRIGDKTRRPSSSRPIASPVAAMRVNSTITVEFIAALYPAIKGRPIVERKL